MSTVAEIHLTGIVGSVKFDKSPEGNEYAIVNLAHNKKRKKPNGEWHTETDWFSVFVSSPRYMETCKKIGKGDTIRVVGDFKIKPYNNEGELMCDVTIYGRLMNVIYHKQGKNNDTI